MILLLAEYSARSIALGALVFVLLKALRVQDPRLERSVWRIVLMFVLSLPALLELSSLSPVQVPALDVSYAQFVTLPALKSGDTFAGALLGTLALVSGAMIIRHAIGIARCWALRQQASRLSPFVYGTLDVRVSSAVNSPATVFSTVIVPADFEDWPAETQRLAIEHERSHVESKDFFVQCLAQLYRSLFWFNPFAWWLVRRLSLLNEHVSDDAAINGGYERTAYAKVLLNLARRPTAGEPMVQMISTHSLNIRIERLLKQTAGATRARHPVLLVCVLTPILAASAAVHAPSHLTGDAQVVLPKSNPGTPLSLPSYPPASRRLGEHGTVVLRLHVLEDGSVADAVIDKSSGYPHLDYAALDESFRWRLDPGTVDGSPSRMWGRFAVTFKLSEH